MTQNNELEKAQKTWESFAKLSKWATFAAIFVIAIIFLIIY